MSKKSKTLAGEVSRLAAESIEALEALKADAEGGELEPLALAKAGMELVSIQAKLHRVGARPRKNGTPSGEGDEEGEGG